MPYYQDEWVTLYLGDCREVDEWTGADVLVTDPPYGIAWVNHGGGRDLRNWAPRKAKAGIAGDHSTEIRDDILSIWGKRPAVVFGSPQVPPPKRTIQVLAWQKPEDSGVLGARFVWRRDLELIYLIGKWPIGKPNRSSIIRSQGGMERYRNGHPHAKPVPLLDHLIRECPPGVIADPFAGSCPTLIAAKALRRKAIGVECDEQWCELAALLMQQDVLNFGGVA